MILFMGNSMVLKTRLDRPDRRPVMVPVWSGQLDRKYVESELDRWNRRFDQLTGRFHSNRTVQLLFKKNKKFTVICTEGEEAVAPNTPRHRRQLPSTVSSAVTPLQPSPSPSHPPPLFFPPLQNPLLAPQTLNE